MVLLAATSDTAATGHDSPGAAVVGGEEQLPHSAEAHNHAVLENYGFHTVEQLVKAGWEPGM